MMAIVSAHSHPDLTATERDRLQRRVQRGAKLLDAEVPGWETRVTRALEMGDVDSCVVGQVFCDYIRGIADLGIDHDDRQVVSFGFERGSDTIDYRDLGIAWENLIATRKRVRHG